MDDETEDYAMSTFESIDARWTTLKQAEAEDNEKWWIVLAAKIAVRRVPTTEGKPMCVLPQGSVVHVKKVEHVDGTRWAVVESSDATTLHKNTRAANDQPIEAAYMLIEGPSGRLLMVAPPEFAWESVRALPPSERGMEARRRILGGPVELSEVDRHRQPPERSQPPAPTSLALDEDADGLVDLRR